jgi:hypothetical protein
LIGILRTPYAFVTKVLHVLVLTVMISVGTFLAMIVRGTFCMTGVASSVLRSTLTILVIDLTGMSGSTLCIHGIFGSIAFRPTVPSGPRVVCSGPTVARLFGIRNGEWIGADAAVDDERKAGLAPHTIAGRPPGAAAGDLADLMALWQPGSHGFRR